MTLSYDEIFSSFLGYVTDHNIASMSIQDSYELMCEWLHKSYSKPYLKRLFSVSSLDDEIQTLTFEMSFVVNDDSDKDFVIDVLAKGMVVEWLQPQVKNKLLISQFFGTKDQKYYSQSNHIDVVKALLEEAKIEQRKIIRDRGYISNSYLEG